MNIKSLIIHFVSKRSKIIEYIKLSILSLLLIILAFPSLDFAFDIGIDPSLAWLFNYLFDSNMLLGSEIIFPHGPLAFIMYPTYQNALIGIIIRLVLQLIFIINIFEILKDYGKYRWLILFIICFYLFKIFNVNLLIISIVLVSYINYSNSGNKYYKYVAIFLTAFAFYIKAYVAIITGIISVSFVVWEYFSSKNWKKTLSSVSIGFFFVLLFWFLMYKSFNGFVHYIIGMFNLAQDNSAAAAIYPENNWVFISFFLIIVLLIPFIQKDKKGHIFAALFILSFFGVWKHSIAREDIYHVTGVFYYTLSSLIIFMIYLNKNFFANLVLVTTALIFFYLNLNNVVGFKPPSNDLTKINNFKTFITDFNGSIELAKNISFKNIAKRKLPQSVIDTIGNKSVDIYPWDYSFIPANNFNWKPRIVIQSYAAYTSWLDEQNAKHFNSNNAPEFIIWHIEGETPTLGDLKSIDERYLLNDEPQTLIEIFKHYTLIDKNKIALIFKKREKELNSVTKLTNSKNINWNNWIPVPEYTGELLRAKIGIRGNFKRKLKSFFYKDEAFYIYYKLENGDLVSKKIVPKNAVDGIWINPFIQSPGDSIKEFNVKEIMLKCSNPKLMKPEITLSWESISFEGDNNFISDFFGKPDITVKYDSVFLETENDFEVSNKYWKETPNSYSGKYFYSGKNSYLLKPGEFSSAFQLSLDTLPKENLQFIASSFILTEHFDKAVLILSLENKNGTILWQGMNTYDNIIDRNAWNYIKNTAEYNNTSEEPVLLKLYFWNTGKNNLFIDNLKMQIKVRS